MLYEYQCSNEDCRHNFEIYESIHADALKNCPSCRLDSLKRVIHAPIIRDKSTPKTVGALGEKNFAKLPKEQQEMLGRKKPELTHKQKIMKNPEKYIMTGEY